MALLAALACSPEAAPPCDDVGILCTVAGDGERGAGAFGGVAVATSLYLPMDVAFDAAGRAHIVDWNNHRVLQIDAAGRAQAFVGSGVLGDGVPTGKARTASIYHPTDVAFAADGGLYVALWHNDVVAAVDAAGALTVVIGSGDIGFAPDGTPAATAAVYLPSKLALDPSGRLCFTEAGNQRVRCRGADGALVTILGPTAGEACVAEACVGKLLPAAFGGDGGPAAGARLALPIGNSAVPAGGLAFDGAGGLVVCDSLNHRVRRLGPDGVVRTIAGGGPMSAATGGDVGDGGPATAATLKRPSDVALAADGTLYIADTDHHCVRAVSPGGVISTVAGRCGVAGASGDGGPATAARLDRPYGVAVGPDGRLWITDTHNDRVRVVRPAAGG